MVFNYLLSLQKLSKITALIISYKQGNNIFVTFKIFMP